MKKIAILFMVLFAMFALQSQTVVKNAAQLQVESAIKNGLFIIKQDYCLADSAGNLYGRNNAEYFGSIVSLGVVADNGYLMQDKAVSPQNYDANYSDYRDYSVVFRKTRYRTLDNYEFYSMPFDKEKIDTVVAGSSYYMKDNVMGVTGFSMDATFGEKDGWLVWAVSDSLGIDNINVELISYKTKKTFRENEDVVEIDAPMTRKNVLGGIFVCPEVKEIGIIQYKLTGILCPQDDKWVICRVKEPVRISLIQTDETSPTQLDTISNNEITPLIPSVNNDTIAPSDADAGGNDDGSNKNKRRWIFGRNKGN